MFFRRKRHPLEQQAEHTANVIQHQLTRLNLAYRSRRSDVETIQRVEFIEPLIATPSEIRIEVDVNRLPRSVTISDLRKTEHLETLTVVCKYPVRAEHKRGKNGGFWYVVELEERSSIPKLVRFKTMQLPPNSPPLAMPIGVGENNQQYWEDLRDLPHLLIAGATKQGKSVLVNAILCQLAQRLGPERLQLYLCDLKGGMELAFYEHLPHVRQFITKAKDLPAMLLTIQTEMERRTDLMRGKARDIEGYNYQVGKEKALPYIVVVVDEIANAMLCKDKIAIDQVDEAGQLAATRKTTVAAESESIMADLAARARATGLHVIIATQRPSVDVVTGLIKANFPCRIAFGTSSDIDSRVIIDNSSAHGLTKGRMKFRKNMELLELQGPLLEENDVKRIVKNIINGETNEPAPESSEDRHRRESALLLLIAESDFGGRFPVKELAKHPEIRKAQISFQRVEEIAKRLEHEQVLKRGFGPKPRSIMARAEDWRAIYPPSVMHHASRTKNAPSNPTKGKTPTKRKTVYTFTPQHLDAALWASAYDAVKDHVKALKFHGEQTRAQELGQLLAHKVTSDHIEADYIIPVPLSQDRREERGYNQSELLAQDLAQRVDIPLLDALERNRWTVPQSHLREEFRKKNLAGAFTVATDEQLTGKTILLIDDVISSGATVDECAKTLKSAGVTKVIALAVGKGGGQD